MAWNQRDLGNRTPSDGVWRNRSRSDGVGIDRVSSGGVTSHQGLPITEPQAEVYSRSRQKKRLYCHRPPCGTNAGSVTNSAWSL